MLRLSLVGVLIALCVSGAPVRASGGESDAYVPPEDPSKPPWQYRMADVQFELESHSPMRRQCRVHLVTVTGEGLGTWGCEDSNEDPIRFTVTEDEVLELLTRAYNAYFFDMPHTYHGTLRVVVGEDSLAYVFGSADVGGDWRALTVTIDGYSKRVEAKDGYPEELGELIGFILGFADRAAEAMGDRPSN